MTPIRCRAAEDFRAFTLRAGVALTIFASLFAFALRTMAR
jgi:hypothetical protein